MASMKSKMNICEYISHTVRAQSSLTALEGRDQKKLNTAMLVSTAKSVPQDVYFICGDIHGNCAGKSSVVIRTKPGHQSSGYF